MACVQDFRDFLIGNDPMQVEHLWQSMYVHTFYRAGPVIGSAISGIDQALWDIRGKALSVPVYQLLGGPDDATRRARLLPRRNMRDGRGLAKLSRMRSTKASPASRSGMPDHDYEWIETNAKIKRAVKHCSGFARGWATPSTSPSTSTPRRAPPSRHHVQRGGAAQAAVGRRAMPAGKRAGHGAESPPSTTPIATGERLVAAYGCRELIEMGVVDILQTDINHVGGISALWKVAAMANISDISMAPHACEGPIGGLATLHVDTAMPNFWSRRSAAS